MPFEPEPVMRKADVVVLVVSAGLGLILGLALNAWIWRCPAEVVPADPGEACRCPQCWYHNAPVDSSYWQMTRNPEKAHLMGVGK